MSEETNVVREFFRQQRKEKKAISWVGYKIETKKMNNLYPKFCGWLANEPDDKVYNYWGDCPMTQFSRSLFPDHKTIGDTDRFFIVDGVNEFRMVPIPVKLGQIIHGCAKVHVTPSIFPEGEPEETCTISAKTLKEAVGV